MPYEVVLSAAAKRNLKKLPFNVQDRLLSIIHSLETDPRPTGTVKIAGSDNVFRIRSGDYRIVYAVKDGILLVLIIAIGHRKEIYRGF